MTRSDTVVRSPVRLKIRKVNGYDQMPERLSGYNTLGRIVMMPDQDLRDLGLLDCGWATWEKEMEIRWVHDRNEDDGHSFWNAMFFESGQ